MQPLISTHFFLQKLTFFLLLWGISRIFWIFCCSMPSLIPIFFSIQSAKHICWSHTEKNFLNFSKVCTSCQPINTFKLSNHCPAHSVKRDFINLLIVHWNRQLQLQVSIKIHLLFLHTLWQEIRSSCTHCDKKFAPLAYIVTRRLCKHSELIYNQVVWHLEMTCCVWPGLRIRFWKSI